MKRLSAWWILGAWFAVVLWLGGCAVEAYVSREVIEILPPKSFAGFRVAP